MLAEPGCAIIFGMPNDEYHKHSEMSNSGLSDFARSPAHFYGLHINPNRPIKEESAGQLVGNLAHCATLEPDQFLSRYPLGPSVRRNTKEWKAFCEAHGSKKPIQRDDYDRAWSIAKSLKSHKELGKLFEKGFAEVSVFCKDAQTGLGLRCRPDWIHQVSDTAVIIVDVKTCGDARPKEFARQIHKMGYHRQAAFYIDVFSVASGMEVLGFVFASCKAEYPYTSSAVMLDELSIQKGRSEIQEMLPRVAECFSTNIWPGPCDGIELVSLPAWAL